MKKYIVAIALVVMAASAANVNAQTDNRTFKQKSEVVADSVRAKGLRIGRKVADGAVLAADSVAAKAPRIGRKLADGMRVVGDSIESKAPNATRKTRNAADTIAVRSKRAFKALKGE